MKWLPLPKIAHGVAIYPFFPSNMAPQRPGLPSNPSSNASVLDDSSIFTSSSLNIAEQQASTDPEDYSHFVSLEVGDELFIVEQQGQWFRGYVLCALEEGKKPNEAPIGCFPRSHVQIKEYIEIDSYESEVSLPFLQMRDSTDEPVNKIPTLANIPRSLSESYIQSKATLNIPIDSNAPIRPGSFSELNLEHQEPDFKKLDHTHIPPPALPLARFDQSTITGSSEPLVDEIAACVSEWNSLLYTYAKKRDYTSFHAVKDDINYLFQARRQLLDQALSREELFKLRKGIIHRMVESNLERNQKMIVRHPEKGYVLDATNTSLSTIYKMHWKIAATIPNMSASLTPTIPITAASSPLKQDVLNEGANSSSTTINTIHSSTSSVSPGTSPSTVVASVLEKQPHQKGAKFYHLFFEFKACVAHICQPGEFTELYFTLYSASDKKYITEQFVVILNHQGMPKDESQIGKLQTVFADLSTHDLLDNVYLVCHIIRLGGLKFTEKEYFGSVGSHAPYIFHSNKHQSIQKQPNALGLSNMCRRPFGCATLKLSSILLQSDTNTSTTSSTSTQQPSLLDHKMPIYTAVTESNYSTLHEDIIFDNNKEFAKNTRAEMVRVSLRTFYGQLDEVLKANTAILHGVPHTLRLGFADAVFPDDNRNELYITLASGDFAQFGRSRNIQVTMCIRDNKTGEVIESAISSGSGTSPTAYWESTVFYHELRPTWGEMIKISMNSLYQWERSHIFLTVKHRSSHYTGLTQAHQSGDSPHSGGGEKILAMGFLPLCLPPLHRDFVADGVHTLHLYKYDRASSNPRAYFDNVSWLSKSSAPSNMQSMELATKTRASSSRKIGQHSSPSEHSLKSIPGSLQASSMSDINSTFSGSTSVQQSFPKLSLLRDTVTLSTFLCSTRFTQNKTLVRLLNWRSLIEESVEGVNELLSILDEFTFIGEVEVVKFLGDIFDALFDILVYEHDPCISKEMADNIKDNALAAIIWVLGIVQDRRFSNFGPVLDVYIENRFSLQEYEKHQQQRQESGDLQNYSYSPAEETTFDELLKSLNRLCKNLSDAPKAKLLRSSMKAWDYLFRFIVRSRLCQQHKEDAEERQSRDVAFKDDIYTLLKAIQGIMRPDQPSAMIGTQTLTLQHFADILAELRMIFPPHEIVAIAATFVDACSHVTGRLVGFKLSMILNIVRGPVFNDPACRLELTKNVFRWIRVWLNSYMATAKDVIFSKHEQSSPDPDHQQIRLPRAQWIENMRLSLTVMSEIMDKLRKSVGMTQSGISSANASLSFTNLSRPTSLATTSLEDEMTSASLENSEKDLAVITGAALELLPQLLNAYKDLQMLTVQALHISGASNKATDTQTKLPSNTRQPSSTPRERGGSINSRNQISEANLESPISSSNVPLRSTHNPNNNTDKSKFTVILQALNSSPTFPFPASYPFQTKSNEFDQSISTEHAAMISTGLLDLTVVMLELFYLTPRQQWLKFLKNKTEQEGVEKTSEFLRKVIYTCIAMLFGDNIRTQEEANLSTECPALSEEDQTKEGRKLPAEWLNLNTIAHQTVLCHVLEPIKEILEMPVYIPSEAVLLAYDDDFELSEEQEAKNTKTFKEQKSALLLWRVYFVGFLRVVGSSALELSQMPPQEQRAVWKMTGNIQGEVGAKTFLSLWELSKKQKAMQRRTIHQHETQLDDRNNKPSIPLFNDYFGSDYNPTLHNGACQIPNRSASMIHEHNYFSDDLFRKSMAFSEEDGNESKNSDSWYSPRHSIRIGPTEEIPLSSIDEEDTSEDLNKIDISFLQADLSYHILSALCSVSLTFHGRVRLSAFTVIADIIALELYSCGELIHIQHVLIGTLDRLIMSENKGDEQLKEKMAVELNRALEDRLQADSRSELIATGKRSVDSLCTFLGILLQIRNLPLDEEFMDERITATLKLMKFIQVIEREEIYIKYVHQLVELHIESNSYVEAALTLRFHANLLLWDTTNKLPEVPDLKLPSQSSFERKEALYMKMISYLEQGNAWEICVDLCKELAFEYENNVYNYTKLSEILQRQAILVDNVVKKDRCYNEYFRVGFYGRGFPPGSRNHQYIYRGLEWEKMTSFVERMQNRHPNAQLLPNKLANVALLQEEQLKELEISLDGQYLQITPVVPIPDTTAIACLSNPHAPDSIKKYYSYNSVSRFSFSRPIVKEGAKIDEEKQPESDFLHLWTEKIDFTCEDRFPNIVRRSKIASVRCQEVSPIENAVMAVENKNEELKSLEKKYSACRTSATTQPTNINPFSMSLNGAVDAPVNGGIPLYKKAFLSEEYWNKNPTMHSWIQRLKEAIYNQVRIISICLRTHDKLVSQDMRPFHATITEFFYKNFAEEIKYLKENKSSAIPPKLKIMDGQNKSVLHSDSAQDLTLQLSPRQNSQSFGISSPPILPFGSSVSRAFSIRGSVVEGSPGHSPNSPFHTFAFENASTSRAESFSHTLKMSLRKKSRRKLPSISGVQSNIAVSGIPTSPLGKPQL
ncbi:hypothetical protein BY458DRAFT_471271 [Sporodiniella umbellata]|nr:hypothetical protein BY458DRAFT_471271 [Sporodiniella umbellata]